MFNIAEQTENWAKAEGINLTVLESVGSTNSYLKENLSKVGSLPHWVVTHTQTNGRGRSQNTWASPDAGHGFLCSVLFKLDQSPQPISAPCFGWAVYRALNEAFHLDFSVKAPNDIYIGEHKIGGILLESVSQGDEHFLILGLGLNVFSHPEVDNSNSILNFMEDREIQENQWDQFLSHFMTLTSQASIACTETEMSDVITDELEKALKKYDQNEIDTLLKDGGLKLMNGSTVNWRDL